jgi:N-acetylmuramoyl-L-alanine amidase
VPVIETFEAFDPQGPPEDSVFVAGMPRLRAWVRGEFDEVRLDVDGVAVSPERRANRLEWRSPGPWSAGVHEARLRVRLSGVGSARERRVRFTVSPATARLRASRWPDEPVPPGGIAAVRVELLSGRGEITRDSSRVRVRSLTRGGFAPADTVVAARDGVAWAYLRVPARSAAGARRATALRVSLEASPDRPHPGVRSDTLRVAHPAPGILGAGSWTGFIRQGDGRTPLRDAVGTREPGRPVAWLNRDGFAVLARDEADAVVVPRLPGYRRAADERGSDPALVAVAGGVLHGRRITLDPEGGGEDAAGVGESGTRAAHLNLEVARILAGFLTAAGADVHLTRAGDFAISEVERVQGSEAFRADRYLRIGHRARRFGYFFSSPGGRRWALNAAGLYGALGLGRRPAVEDAAYPLQQTSCPAIYASPARVDSVADEQALLGPGALRAEAYALFLSLAREWAAGADWPLDSIEVRGPDGNPLPAALVTLGDALVLETDASGRARFARTEPGPIEAVVHETRVRARALLLDSTRGAVLTGPAGD